MGEKKRGREIVVPRTCRTTLANLTVFVTDKHESFAMSSTSAVDPKTLGQGLNFVMKLRTRTFLNSLPESLC